MKITRMHGAGGKLMQELIEKVILGNLELTSVEGGVGLRELDDGGTVPLGDREIIFTIDGHTVKPIFFPGGDIGKLAVCGAVNDIAVMGGEPVALSLSLIIPEGFPIDKLDRIMKSINETSKEAGVPIITGDTKVSNVDDIVITTAGIGITERGKVIRDSGMKERDVIIVSGNIGEHGMTILLARENFDFKSNLKSDVAPLNKLIKKVLDSGVEVHAMKDPTRGGLASALNEMVEKSGLGINIYEEKIPISEEVQSLSEALGIDPLTVANEGKVVMAVKKEDGEKALEVLRSHPLGRNAQIIGEVVSDHKMVVMETLVGRRIIDTPMGDPIPRVC
ncbi:MAG TPA: hydrogenase expression/formation protein HypE [Methanothermococcus okinawensis]|uniref:Hydrogenase expression/formation protein HypE n=1 Tax=Methanofervidicoccus abyssi TaxID=2082189 RepID=A0A401HNN3_9EURY|nr:hydrogenase expression/formation protein HypE [Methanofervidicoccus abyssi]GBF35848.1 hydrogenase expression/formation protein HypE [Methanofervidicoccus abyssi]HIP16320.1 hydrogenase expression/formation protein HypE [Methanothermococcus okinawensis]